MLRCQPTRALASPTNALLSSAVLAALAVPAAAQQLQFEQLAGQALPASTTPSTAITTGDIDGDGDTDMIVGNTGGPNKVYVNDGTGVFFDETSTRLPAMSNDTNSVALGDIDGDGDLDLVFGNGTGSPPSGQQNRLYTNDGTGTFTDVTATQLPAHVAHTGTVTLGDIDGDGDLDMAVGNTGYMYTSPAWPYYQWSVGQQNRLYLNDGQGTFTDATATLMPGDADSTVELVLGDVDGDGDLDMAMGNTHLGYSYLSVQDRLYLNDGSGSFTDVTATHMPVDVVPTTSVVLGDVDGDGDLDMALGRTGQKRLYINNGSGVFTDETATQLPIDNETTRALAFSDIDADGDLDLILANNGQNKLYINDGSGMFADGTATRFPTDSDDSVAVVLTDVDRDDDVDLVFGNAGQQDQLNTNLRRHLNSPIPFVIGQTYQLDVYLRHGPASPADLALPFASFAPASIPMPPFGIVGIDTSQLVALPVITIPQPAGIASLSFFAPNLPTLIGITLYSQALIVDTQQARLSNVTSSVFEASSPPVIGSISPPTATSGTPVLIFGTNFLTGVALSVGGNPTPITSSTTTSIGFTMPPGHGCNTQVVVANLGNSIDTHTINPTPTVSSAPFNSGPAAGGVQYFIVGQHLGGATVTFNGVPMSISTQSSGVIFGSTPPGTPGPATVVVSSPIGCQVTLSYTYL